MLSQILVAYGSPVTAYGTAYRSSHSGWVNDCTRSAVFHRSPKPLRKLSTVRNVMNASSHTHAVRTRTTRKSATSAPVTVRRVRPRRVIHSPASADSHSGVLRADVLELGTTFDGQQWIGAHNLRRQRPEHLVPCPFELDGR